MRNLNELSLKQLKAIVAIKEKIAELEAELADVFETPRTSEAPAVRGGGMSSEGKARIAAAQRARWAKQKGPKTGKRTMSPAQKAAISAKMKASWAARKAGKGK